MFRQSIAIIGLLAPLAGIWARNDSRTTVDFENYTQLALSPVEIVRNEVVTMVNDYMNSSSLANATEVGAWSGQGTAVVEVSTSHPDWGKSRAIAYKQAWSMVQEEFIRYQLTEVSTEIVRKLYEDASGSEPQHTQATYTGRDAIQEFINKTDAHGYTKLDAALKGIDIDPSEYKKSSTTRRITLLESSITQKTIARSFGELSGLWPLMTFSSGAKGQYAVGVVGLYKPSFADIAASIASGRALQVSVSKRKSIKQRIPSDSRFLAESFGVRLVEDVDGFPALVSFGQWGLNTTSTHPVILSKFRDMAIQQARSQADAAIALFLAGTANYIDSTYVGSILEDFIDVEKDGALAPGESSRVEDMIEQVLTSRATTKVSGLRDVKTWEYTYPNSGQKIVGVVRAWTVKNARAASELKSMLSSTTNPVGLNTTSNAVAEAEAEKEDEGL